MEEILDYLDRRRDFLEGVVISGGEPTIQPGLVKLCTIIRRLGYPVKLDTNGSRPGMLERLIQAKLVDYVAMDVKTHPLLYRHHLKSSCDPAAFLESIRMIIDSGIDHEFRTTCVHPIVSPGIIDAIARLIGGARRFVLQRFRHSEILRPDFFRSGHSHPYTRSELGQLKAIASPLVASCCVR
jgi:pyruvate formate lyase activating enzyme